jgi:diguanylate cyclase (GGDEF)-like protein
MGLVLVPLIFDVKGGLGAGRASLVQPVADGSGDPSSRVAQSRYGIMTFATSKPGRWLPQDRSLQVAVGMWIALALVGPLYLALPGVDRGHAAIVFFLSGVAVLCAALIVVMPDRLRLRFMYPVGIALSLGVVSVVVAATGGADSPLRGFALFYVVYGAWFLPRRAGERVLMASILANLLPLIYDGGALTGASLGRTVVLAGTFVVSGAAIIAVRSELTETVALDTERLKTIVSLHREVERSEFDVQDVVLEILDRARILLGASAASAGIIEGDQIAYKYRTGPGRGSGVAIRTPRDHSLSGICFQTGEAVYCEDSETDPRVDRVACRAQELRSMIIVPLRHRGEIVGVLNVNSPEAHTFDGNDVRTVQLVAGAISAAYGHAVDIATKQQLLDELETTVTALKDSEAKLGHQALHDPLTNLPNRTLFLDRLRTALAEQTQPRAAVLFVDLDGFKVVNDSLGHDAGDALLVQTAERISGVLRQSDTAARLGGDEFVIICTDDSPVSAAVHIAERLIKALEVPFTFTDRDAPMTASIGIASHDGPAETLLRDADAAMYSAKAGGKAHYEIFEPKMHAEAQARLELSGLLRVVADKAPSLADC